LCSFEHIFAPPLAAFVNGSFDTVYDGLGGDMLTSGLFLTKEKHRKLSAGDLDGLVPLLISHAERPLPYLNREHRERFSSELAVRRLKKELELHRDAANPVTSFYFWNRTRRNVALAPYCFYDQVQFVHTPYVDHELFDFLSSQPAELFMDGTFHTEALRFRFPSYADVRFENKTKAYAPPGYYRSLATDMAKHMLRHKPFRYLSPTFCFSRVANMALNPWITPRQAWSFRKLVYFFALQQVTDKHSE